jgi:preprotein translocase subunit Sec61beta
MRVPIEAGCTEQNRSRQLEPRTAVVIGITGIVLATIVIAMAHVSWP